MKIPAQDRLDLDECLTIADVELIDCVNEWMQRVGRTANLDVASSESLRWHTSQYLTQYRSLQYNLDRIRQPPDWVDDSFMRVRASDDSPDAFGISFVPVAESLVAAGLLRRTCDSVDACGYWLRVAEDRELEVDALEFSFGAQTIIALSAGDAPESHLVAGADTNDTVLRATGLTLRDALELRAGRWRTQIGDSERWSHLAGLGNELTSDFTPEGSRALVVAIRRAESLLECGSPDERSVCKGLSTRRDHLEQATDEWIEVHALRDAVIGKVVIVASSTPISLPSGQSDFSVKSYFDHYFTPSTGFVFVPGVNDVGALPFVAVRVYLWSNAANRPMWTHGTWDFRRLVAVEMGTTTSAPPYGRDGRLGGYRLNQASRPLFIGAALQPLPYATVSGGFMTASWRTTGSASQNSHRFFRGYFAVALDANLAGLIATALRRK